MHSWIQRFLNFFYERNAPKTIFAIALVFHSQLYRIKKIPECKKRLWKLSHVVFEDVCNDVGRNVGEVNEVRTIFKSLTQPIDPLFGSRHAVNPLHG